jgi:hypothetical protein
MSIGKSSVCDALRFDRGHRVKKAIIWQRFLDLSKNKWKQAKSLCGFDAHPVDECCAFKSPLSLMVK